MKPAVLAAAVAVFAIAHCAARAESCQSEVGRRQAAQLVERCLEVSPATRPPCNAANACSLIESEIVRGCRIVADDAPRWCGEY